ncbi:hypothetical protein [Actinomadura sp. 7K534]|uniref:hypothetical protein n=1 Tax=Actinomadura sp. 7K534 TaxID=2530366 RepID=UPI001404FFF9|nr:hypothetical protein [Actinomadura sp. 7K534]
MIEARERPAGSAQGGLRGGGEFAGRPHRRLRALTTRLGLRTRRVPGCPPIPAITQG